MTIPTANSSKTTKKLVPQLRFPEFSGEWERKRLGDLGTFFSGGTPKSTNKEYYSGKIPFIKSGEISKIETAQFINNEGFNNSSAKMVEKGDLLYALYGATSGEVGISKINGAINQAVLCIRSSIDNYFLYSFLLKNKTRILDSFLQGGQGNLSSKIIKELKLNLPQLPEQQKIANFLSLVDQKIDLLQQQKTALKTYKKGLLQQLFSQKLRFKNDEGNTFPDWEEKRFRKYIKLYRGSSPRPISRFQTKDENGVNWIKIGDTKESNNYVISSVSEKITREGSLKSRKVDKGELILANSMSFGKTYKLEISGCIYDGWFVLREYEESFDKDFLLQLLNSVFLQKQYKRLSTGGVVQNISSDIVYSTKLIKPSLPEQTKIANFLSLVDQRIENVQTQVSKTKEFKKGLLQQLFV